MSSVLVTGAAGQIGSELTGALRERDPDATVIATDIQADAGLGDRYIQADVTNEQRLGKILGEYDIDTVYHLAALLSAEGEDDPSGTFKINVGGLRNLINLAQEYRVNKIIVPSSIAVYGPMSPQNPDETAALRPTTMYGITKATTEHLGRYYSQHTSLDVRGARFPGVISYKTKPSGGTTDYAVNAFYHAVNEGEYTYFVRANTRLPMIYISDAVRGLISLAKADRSDLRFYCEYNIMGLSFTASDLTSCIQERIPEFQAQYVPDDRQTIADSWPATLDDTAAREDWGWQPEYDLDRITDEMIQNLADSSSQFAFSE